MTLSRPFAMMRRMLVLYEVLLYLVAFLSIPWFLIRALSRGKYLRNLAPRLGRYTSAPASHDLWIHAVSVGEVLVARPVIEELLRLRPATTVILTTTTLTGQSIAASILPEVPRTYFPFDFSFAVRRFLDHHGPRLFLTMETEIWPNVIWKAAERGVVPMIANGRISDRSFPRYRLARPLLRPILARYRKIMVREPLDAERFQRIGARPETLEVTGNIKFDLAVAEPHPDFAAGLGQLRAGRPLLVIGSLLEGEEPILLPLIAELARTSFVVVAPRKPERFGPLADRLLAAGVSFLRRSRMTGADPAGRPGVLLLDTIGELAAVYGGAVAAFVGGSLVDAGGHNPIEPVAAGCPVAFGPSMSNFREIAARLRASGAALEVSSAEELGRFFGTMIDDVAAREAMIRSGMECVAGSRGAAARTAERIVEALAR